MILEHLPERRKHLELTLGTQTLTAAVLGSSVYHEGIGAGKCSFGILLWFMV